MWRTALLSALGKEGIPEVTMLGSFLLQCPLCPGGGATAVVRQRLPKESGIHEAPLLTSTRVALSHLGTSPLFAQVSADGVPSGNPCL